MSWSERVLETLAMLPASLVRLPVLKSRICHPRDLVLAHEGLEVAHRAQRLHRFLLAARGRQHLHRPWGPFRLLLDFDRAVCSSRSMNARALAVTRRASWWMT